MGIVKITQAGNEVDEEITISTEKRSQPGTLSAHTDSFRDDHLG